jgi:PAS domain S-box-containing protein
MDTPELSIRELDALFEQSPVAMIFTDNEMRARRANTAFRQLMGFPKGDLLGRPPTRQPGISQILDTQFVERTLTEQVIKQGVPVVNVPLELTVEGKHHVAAWTAYRVTDNGRVFGVVSTLVDITSQAQADTDLRQANTRLDLLQRAGSEIGTTLDVRRTAEELTALATPGLADRVVVDLLDLALLGEDPIRTGSGEVQFRRYALLDTVTPGAGNFSVGEEFIVPVAQQPARVFFDREPLVARNREEVSRLDLPASILRPLLDRGVHALIEVPLTARGVALGVAGFARSKTPEPYCEADVRLACDLTARAALHIDNARLYTREHDAAVTLQRSLLPRDIPQVAGLDIAWRFQSASGASEIGGDWFDVIAIDGGQVALVAGDAAGHGILAAAAMGQLRTTTGALALLGSPPDQIMRQLSRTVAARGDEASATCLHAQYDPASRRCRLTSAGHPLPALRHPDGSTEIIDLPAGLLLGVDPDSSYLSVDRQLAPGSILAMYTDGLIERPGEDLGTGMSRLARALADGPAGSLDELADSVLASLAPHPRDDVVLLLARSTGDGG